VNSFLRDIRCAARVLLNSRITTAVAVLALALGIGVNASSFISIDSMVLHPLPYPNLDRIVTVWETLPKVHTQQTPLSPADFTDILRESHSFFALAAYRGWDASLIASGLPERIESTLVSPGFFTALGTRAELGRTFVDENQAAQARVVVVSEGFWKSHLAGSSAAIGKPIFLNGSSYTVIGVMPDRFDFPLGTQVWAPLALEPGEQQDRDHHNLMAIGLLQPNVSTGEASSELSAIASRLQKQYPSTNEDRSTLVLPLRSMADRVTNHFVVTLLGAAGFVLLLACANIGNLQLARATTREREIAVRAALGASRLQIARELFAESLLISAGASVVGLLLASWSLAWMKTTIPPYALRIVPGLRTMRVDGTVILFTVTVSIAAGVLCSFPAIAQMAQRCTRIDLNDVLRGRGAAAGSTPGRNALRTGLIVFELALALVLLVGAGLMVKTFERLLYVDQGFDPKNLLTLHVSLPTTEYRSPSQMISFYDQVLENFRTLRSASAAGVCSYLGPAENFRIEGQPQPQAGEPRPNVRAVSGHYLQSMRIPVIEGRSISEADRAESRGAVVISENLARHYWPHSSAVGHRIQWNATSGWLTIVGVTRNVVENWFENQPASLAYVSYAQFPSSQATLLVRTMGDPMQAATSALRDLRRIDSSLPVYDVKSMERQMYEERGGIHAAATTMTGYAVISLLLAVTGIYAVISYFVAAREHDIGVHMALGANRADVFKMTITQGLRFIGAGLALGVPLAVLLSKTMSAVLFNVVQIDASTFATFTLVLAASGLLATYLPSRRATRIDPMTALRNE
jgi:putative ABC transport system permease protein